MNSTGNPDRNDSLDLNEIRLQGKIGQTNFFRYIPIVCTGPDTKHIPLLH